MCATNVKFRASAEAEMLAIQQGGSTAAIAAARAGLVEPAQG